MSAVNSNVDNEVENDNVISLAGYSFVRESETSIRITHTESGEYMVVPEFSDDALHRFVYRLAKEIILFAPTYSNNVAFLVQEASTRGYKTALDAMRNVLNRAEEVMTRTQH